MNTHEILRVWPHSWWGRGVAGHGTDLQTTRTVIAFFLVLHVHRIIRLHCTVIIHLWHDTALTMWLYMWVAFNISSMGYSVRSLVTHVLSVHRIKGDGPRTNHLCLHCTTGKHQGHFWQCGWCCTDRSLPPGDCDSGGLYLVYNHWRSTENSDTLRMFNMVEMHPITSCETTCLILNFSQLQDVHFAVVTVERAQHRGRWQEDGRLCRLVLLWGACCCWQFRKYYTKRASFPSLEVQWLSTQPSAWRSILRQGFIWGVWLIVHCWGIGIHLSHFTCYISVWHTELPQICIMWETWLYDVIQFEVSRHLWTLQDTSATYQCRHAEDKCVLISEFGWVGMLLWPPNRDQTLQLCRES